MPLKRLELSDFKSYRGKQTIDFGNSPFACIIGPNGSGKSNLMDAISFVLGVKSAQLRSTQLKDLVYRGRKLTGAGQKRKVDDVMDEDDEELSELSELSDEEEEGETTNDAKTAWVMAVYEDAKGKEYKFKRLISTAGTSSYQLNGKTVTWTLYNQALEQHNILVKAKNFLVFQGDVEQIASQSSKDLAKLVDSISGSADLAQAYNTAKAAQEKAQELATSNFTKKRGIASELKQFKEQKEEIARWETLRDDKDEVVLQQILWKLFHIDASIGIAVAKVDIAGSTIKSLRKNVKAQDKKLEDKRKAQSAAKLDVKKAQAAVHKAEKALEEKKPEVFALETQIAHSIKKSRNASELAERVRRDEARQADSVKTLKAALKETQEDADAAAERQRLASAKKGVALTAADLQEYRKLRSEANVLAVTERQKLEGIRRQQKTARNAVAAARDKLEVVERKRAALLEQKTDLLERDETMTAKLLALNKEKEQMKAELDQANANRARISQAETEANEKLQDALNKILQVGVSRSESERETRLKETLANLKRVFSGVHGRVVDLVKPTGRRYETAVMTVLGRNIDAIVVDHEKTAIECIEYMRNQRAGQATFIPLDTIQVQPVQEKFRNIAKGARLAIDVIQCDTTVARAVQHACGSSLICDTLEIAKHVRYGLNQEVKAVSLDGTVVHKSGLMTGGQGSGDKRHFGEAEVANLYRMRDKYTAELQELAKSKPKAKNDELLLDAMRRLDVDLTIARDELAAVRGRLESANKELVHVQGEITKATPDLQERAAALSDQDGESEKLLVVVNAAEDEVFKAFCRRIKVADIREYEDVQLRVAEEGSEARVKYATQIARLTHQSTFETEQLKNTRERLKSLESTIQSEKNGLAALERDKAALEAELKQAESEIEDLQSDVDAAGERYREASKETDDAKSAATAAQRALDKCLREIASTNDEIEKLAAERRALYRRCKLEDLDLPLAKGSLNAVPLDENLQDGQIIAVDEDNLHRAIEVDDFGIQVDYDSLEDEEREDGSPEMAANFDKRLVQITTEIERLAPNMKAIDRFDDVQIKLSETEKEARQAKEESAKAREDFNELKKQRCDLFNKAFSHMSGCIDKVYKDLTKGKAFPMGGVAYLSLEDDDEPYLSGVKYNTMPPGKRFVEIEQLSGGEKTMAALALLFAIHSYQPSPFFVLDEVDAALDNTNVAKLANYIREQASSTFQFLIISLKSSLYERSDSLVGVYREQEINSSKTLTLDLQEYED